MLVPLLLIDDSELTYEYEIQTDKLTIGRHVDNVLPINDNRASRFHAQVEKREQGWFLRDLNSSNGTNLNGKRVQESPLKTGDVIQIGAIRMEFKLIEAPDKPAPVARPVAPSMAGGPSSGSSTGGHMMPMDPTMSPEDRLVNMAAGLSPGFFANDIVILNARGQIALAPIVGKKAETGDPQVLFRLILLLCAASGASDIHIEPREKDFLVRVRVDGNMIDACIISHTQGTRLMSMIKVLCDIDIAHKASVQEGHFTARLPRRGVAPGAPASELRRVDYRISYAPGVFGQKLVVRVQDETLAPARIENLQLPEWMVEELKIVIEQDSGMVLVSGPTGSGKTTTLYALLRSIDATQRNVVTIENPVEIQIPGITQLPVDEAQGKTFSALLRSVLRQDPDIILVGEVRDEETARTAMQAAITGHLVFSTLHTKDTFGTIYRLLDLGIEPFLLSQGLATVLAQRLVRQLCPHCKRPVKPTPAQAKKLSVLQTDVPIIYEAGSCPKCFLTGYAGRRAVFELLSVTEPMREAIAHKKTLGEIMQAAEDGKFVKLIRFGYQLVADGHTSMEDIDRGVGR